MPLEAIVSIFTFTSVNGAKAAVAKSVAGTDAAKKTSAGSKPLGTVKYKDGKMPA